MPAHSAGVTSGVAKIGVRKSSARQSAAATAQSADTTLGSEGPHKGDADKGDPKLTAAAPAQFAEAAVGSEGASQKRAGKKRQSRASSTKAQVERCALLPVCLLSVVLVLSLTCGSFRVGDVVAVKLGAGFSD